MQIVYNFFLNHYLKILGICLLLLSYECFAWYVYLDNPRFANKMFPRLEYIFFKSYPEFATYYGLEKGLIGFRENYFRIGNNVIPTNTLPLPANDRALCINGVP